ncbi:hypothetical protein QWJ34_01145 [Saccharibacillus sp. CPCC 101409]|uniref:hypothetical protein n=1 Tax=Saccharibacillus sp. CPCC 101409 TaxID=3058041 RepID=UPI0026729BE0|nr:hypothetical protein [Saccharibacillus sp. CPCC 101409]MDO3408366.1 hypothetical protein [Saccharibacillus sp. CPCC 101409]
MRISTIDSGVTGIHSVQPVQPVQRAQPAAAYKFKLPEAPRTARSAPRKASAAGRRLTVREDGWFRQYSILPDGTRILLGEWPANDPAYAPLPKNAAPYKAAAAAPDAEHHDPEDSMKESGRKLKKLLEAGREP